jgi:hypothetical protein
VLDSLIKSKYNTHTIEESTLECEYLADIKDWATNKIDLLHEADRHRNAKALEAEFYEWIHIPDGVDEIEYIYMDMDSINN